MEEVVQYYNGAKIVLNIHRTTENDSDNKNSLGAAGSSINPRTYEISACGAFQLTDLRDDLPQYYTPGVEIEAYSSPHEAMQKMIYYLSHEQERVQIAMNGLNRTLREHTYLDRIHRLLNLTFQ